MGTRISHLLASLGNVNEGPKLYIDRFKTEQDAENSKYRPASQKRSSQQSLTLKIAGAGQCDYLEEKAHGAI